MRDQNPPGLSLISTDILTRQRNLPLDVRFGRSCGSASAVASALLTTARVNMLRPNSEAESRLGIEMRISRIAWRTAELWSFLRLTDLPKTQGFQAENARFFRSPFEIATVRSWDRCRAALHIHYREQSSGAAFPANLPLVQSSTAWVLAWAALPWPMFGIESTRTLLPAPHSRAA